MWDWIWLEDADEHNSECVSDESLTVETRDEECNDSAEPSDDDDNNIPAITHSVTFKCIGCTKEMQYQEVLASANQKIKCGEAVPVKLQSEPSNQYDSHAVAFMCLAENDWKRIGYVVSEALSDVNEAIRNNKIIKVYFDWIKYIVYFKSPGWYAGITVVRNGNWSRTVMQSGINKCILDYQTY